MQRRLIPRRFGTGLEQSTTSAMLESAFSMSSKQAQEARSAQHIRMYGAAPPPISGEIFLKYNPSLFQAIPTPDWFVSMKGLQLPKSYDLQYLSRLFVQFAHQNVKLEGNTLSEGESWKIVKEMYGAQRFYFKMPGVQSATAQELKHDVAKDRVGKLDKQPGQVLKHDVAKDRDVTELIDQLRAIQEATAIPFEDLSEDTLTVIWEATVASDSSVTETIAYPFRNGDMMVRGSPSVFPQGVEVPALMGKYFEWLHAERTRVRNNPDHSHPILFATEVFSNLVRIHPFKDGNGRVARMLMAICLTSFGYPPVVYVDVDRTEYIRSVFELVQGDSGYFLSMICESIRGNMTALGPHPERPARPRRLAPAVERPDPSATLGPRPLTPA